MFWIMVPGFPLGVAATTRAWGSGSGDGRVWEGPGGILGGSWEGPGGILGSLGEVLGGLGRVFGEVSERSWGILENFKNH